MTVAGSSSWWNFCLNYDYCKKSTIAGNELKASDAQTFKVELKIIKPYDARTSYLIQTAL